MISDCTLTNIMTYQCKNILGYLYFESSNDNPRFINTIFFCSYTFNQWIFTLDKCRKIWLFGLCNILVILQIPCNIDIATIARFLKFLATFFCNIFVAKIAVLATLFNVERKNVNVAKKKPIDPPPQGPVKHLMLTLGPLV